MHDYNDYISREIHNRLILFCDLLQKWQRSLNLIGTTTQEDLWHRHIVDSLQIIPLIPSKTSAIVDFGTGAGFPGLILSICEFNMVTLIESDIKKAAFLKEAIRITQANATLCCDRIEKTLLTGVDVITSRACSSLEKLFALSLNKMSDHTICLFHKGKNYANEIAMAEKKWAFDCEIIPSITDKTAAILKISNLARK